MYPSPKSISVHETIVVTYFGKSFIKIEITAPRIAASATPAMNLEETCPEHIKTNSKISWEYCDIIPLRAERVGEFIEIRHKNISPTRILGTLECLWLCDSVTLSSINPQLSQQPALGLGQNFFFLRPVLGKASTVGQKNTTMFSYLGHFTWDWAEIWNLSSTLKKKIFFL